MESKSEMQKWNIIIMTNAKWNTALKSNIISKKHGLYFTQTDTQTVKLSTFTEIGELIFHNAQTNMHSRNENQKNCKSGHVILQINGYEVEIGVGISICVPIYRYLYITQTQIQTVNL